MDSATSLLQGLKYMIITLDIKIIIIKLEILEPFRITQSKLMDQYIWNSLNNNVRTSNSIKHFKNQYKKDLICLYK